MVALRPVTTVTTVTTLATTAIEDKPDSIASEEYAGKDGTVLKVHDKMVSIAVEEKVEVRSAEEDTTVAPRNEAAVAAEDTAVAADDNYRSRG